MPTADEWLAVLNDTSGEQTSPDRTAEDWLSELNGDSDTYQPPLPIARSYEQGFRQERLHLIRERAGAGEQVDFAALPQRRPGQQSTIGGVPAEQTALANMSTLERGVFAGLAGMGAAIENPVLRLLGRGSEADKNTRALAALNSYNRESSKNSIFGETIGPVISDVTAGLTTGTAASAAAPVRGGLASLGLVSAAFGLNGADKAYVEAKDAGLPEGEAGKAGARQFIVDGLLTFVGGKAVQSMGLNMGRYFGQVVGRASQQVAQSSGLSQVIGSAMADSTVNGIQGGLTYLNEVYTGLHDFDLSAFASAASLSAAVGGVAGAATSGVQQAFTKFQADLPKAVAGATAANEFIARATPEQVQKALVAETVKDFEAATGQKGKGPVHREGFLEELESLVELQRELESKGVAVRQSLDLEEKALAERRTRVEQDALEFEGVPKEAEKGRTPARKAEIAQIKERVTAERKAIAEDQMALDELRSTTEGEAAQYRAYLESELDRLASAEAAEGGAPEADFDVTPPARERTPATFSKQYSDVDAAIQAVGDVMTLTGKGQSFDDATRKDLGKLIDSYVEGQSNRVAMFNNLAKARTPGAIEKVMGSLGKHIHNAERRIAKRDFDDAVKKARNLRPEFNELVTAAKKNADPKVTDSLRDASEAIRDATYQSGMADTFLAGDTAKGIAETAGQVVGEMELARPLAMKADDPIRQAIGQDTPGLEITRDSISFDSPFFREMAARPEVQLSRLSETLRQRIYERLGVEDQAKYDLAAKETIQGLSDFVDSIGLAHPATLDATIKNKATQGKGTPLEKWRTESRTIEGIRVSRDEAAMLFYLGLDPRNAKVLEEGGFVFPDGRQFKKIDERTNNQLVDFIGDEGLQIADWMFQYGNGPLIDRVNDAKRLLTGRPLTERRDVVPRNVERTWDIVGDDPLKALQNATVQSYGHLKHRDDTKKPLTAPEGTTGIFDYFLNHADRMNRVAAFLPGARDAQAILNNPEVQKAIEAKDGRQGLENLQEAVRMQTVGPRRVSGVERSIARWNAVNAAATLGARLTTMLIQGSSTIASSAWNPKGVRTFLHALPEVMSQETQNRMDATLGQHSGHYWRRYNSAGAAGEQTGGVYQSRGWFRPPSIAEHALRPMQETERLVNSQIRFAQAEQLAAEAGLTPDMPEWGPAVAREWERATYRGENASHGMELSGLLRAGRESPVLGAAVTFQNTASKIYSLFPRATDLMDQGRYKDAIGVLGVAIAAQLPVALIRQAMTLGETEDPFLEAAGKKAILDTAGLHPLGSIALQPLVLQLMGMRQYRTGPALVNNIVGTATAVGELASGIIQAGDESDDPQKFAENLHKAGVSLATLSGLPVQGPDDFRKRLVEGTMFPGVKRGEDEPSWDQTINFFTAGE